MTLTFGPARKIRFALFALATLSTTQTAAADDTLTPEPLSAAPVEASLVVGQTATVKTGEVVYWEDERKIPLAIFLGTLDKGSSFWSNERHLQPDARLRLATFNGEIAYCALDIFARTRNKGHVVCLFDTAGDGQFELARTLLPHRLLGPRQTEIASDKLEPPVAYRTETSYGSTGGFRAVYRYRGLANGKIAISCKMEPKAALPESVQRTLDLNPGVLAEMTTVAPAPAPAPMTVAAPLCLSIDLLQVGPQRTAPFKIRSLTGNRMLKFEVTAADAQSISLRLVQPLAPWILFYDAPKDGAAAITVEHPSR